MPFTVYAKDYHDGEFIGESYNDFVDVINILNIESGFIVSYPKFVFYVKSVDEFHSKILSLGEYPGYALLYSGGVTTVLAISVNERDRYLAKFSELASNYSTEKATELIDILDGRLTQIIDGTKDFGIDTEPVSNVKRSSVY